MCTAYNIRVTGRVQGVWFRKYTKDKALELGLKGIVRNMEDGSVFIEVSGDDKQDLVAFIHWLHSGSPQAKVAKVILSKELPCKDYKDFRIVR